MKPQRSLIPEWRRAWRFGSVQAAALLGLLSLLQTDALPLLQGLLPARTWAWVTLGFAVGIAVLRVVAQPVAMGAAAAVPADAPGDKP